MTDKMMKTVLTETDRAELAELVKSGWQIVQTSDITIAGSNQRGFDVWLEKSKTDSSSAPSQS